MQQHVTGTMTGAHKARGDFARDVNVGDTERIVSAVLGGALVAWGVMQRSLGGLGLAAAGGALAWRALSGHCGLYRAFGFDSRSPDATTRGNLGVKIDRSIEVNAAPERVYAFWRRFENLPRILSNVVAVRTTGDTRSHWTVRAVGGATVEWDAEIINDKPDELIAWQSMPGASVRHAGSVRFERSDDGRGTRIHVALQYDPPGGPIGHAVAALLNADAGTQVEQDLGNFKQAFEAGHLSA
jgi:uncharacterized membrane protein